LLKVLSAKSRYHFLWLFGILTAFSLLAACEPEATPFPVDIPIVPTVTPTPGAPLPIRYAVAPNANGLVADINLIMTSAAVEQLAEPVTPDDLGRRYEVVAAYGEWSGWTRSTSAPHVALVIATNSPPLDMPLLANLVRHSIDPQAIVTALDIPGTAADAVESTAPEILRTELANMGFPDGFELTSAYAYIPGAAQATGQWQKANIVTQPILMSDDEIVAAFEAKWLHLALVAWTTAEQRQAWIARVGEANMIDLYTLPISYQAVPELTVTLSPDGWPLPVQ
jgi:hypothetical protein